ncbi:DUF481 domain-containing protein [Alteromonas antoniana]|uniref:DUF481 domain-containing protein n=1 Tax=Alteromonas antoniana TaxID=2803813 RepID=UPI001C447893|nr:DUF481 domain-containing protein [Alteromonas antoniana]
MKQKIVLCSLAFACLAFHAVANASDRNLIQTLYHADFVPDADDDVPHFSLDGELGILAATGNTDTTSLKAGITSEHETVNWSNSYFAELLYKESEVAADGETTREKTAQRFFGYAQFDYKLDHPGRRLFMYSDYENDAFNGYDYRASLAAGWSQRLWRNEESEFRYSVGPGYAFISAEPGTTTSVNNGVIMRASAEYRYRWPSGARLRQFVSTETGADNTKSRSETSISANLFGSLAMKLSVILNHETDAAEDVDPLNTETSVALVYQFF